MRRDEILEHIRISFKRPPSASNSMFAVLALVLVQFLPCSSYGVTSVDHSREIFRLTLHLLEYFSLPDEATVFHSRGETAASRIGRNSENTKKF